MALALGLSSADFKQYMTTLRSPHEIKVTVQVLTATHGVVSTISHLLLDGQVDGEAPEGDKSDIANARTAILRFLDPKRTLTFDAYSPNDGAVFFDRMLRVIYSVYTGRSANGGWVDVPVMTGPIVNFRREGNEAVIEAHGKEEFGLGQAFKTYKYAAGSAKVTVIRSLLANTGETTKYMRKIPSSGGERNPKAVSVTSEEKLWPVASQLAKGMKRGTHPQRLFYNARGEAVLQPININPVMQMGGSYPNLTSDPQVNFSMADVKNAVKIIGRKVAGQTAVVQGVKVAPATHPLSPNRLGRNGKGRYYFMVQDQPNVIGQAAANALAQSQLTYWLAQQVEATWECLPVPHLEPWDKVTLVTDKFSCVVPVRRFTLPLVVGPSMTIGATRAVSRPRRR